MPTTEDISLAEADRRALIHPFTALKQYASGELGDPRIVRNGDGIYIFDGRTRQPFI